MHRQIDTWIDRYTAQIDGQIDRQADIRPSTGLYVCGQHTHPSRHVRVHVAVHVTDHVKDLTHICVISKYPPTQLFNSACNIPCCSACCRSWSCLGHDPQHPTTCPVDPKPRGHIYIYSPMALHISCFYHAPGMKQRISKCMLQLMFGKLPMANHNQ